MWSVLLRCIYSIWNRSPPSLLHEIILINDKSDDPQLSHNLRSFIEEKFGGKVKLFENEVRQGLIRARLFGAQQATGDVIVFLDSHIEVNTNWLPPLLEPIALNPKTATVPIIGGIDPRTLEFSGGGDGSRGCFDWDFVYKWLPRREEDDKNPGEPFPLGAMTGFISYDIIDNCHKHFN
jgi:polypeptide N-acetylgalactosaminyltransferase